MSYTQSFGKLLNGKSCSIRFSSRVLPVVKQFSHFPETFPLKFHTISSFLKVSEFSVDLKNARGFLRSRGAVERNELNSRSETQLL